MTEIDIKHKDLLLKYNVEDLSIKHNKDKIMKGGLIARSLDQNKTTKLNELKSLSIKYRYYNKKYRIGDIIMVNGHPYIIVKDVYEGDSTIECIKVQIVDENVSVMDDGYVLNIPNYNFIVQRHIDDFQFIENMPKRNLYKY